MTAIERCVCPQRVANCLTSDSLSTGHSSRRLFDEDEEPHP